MWQWFLFNYNKIGHAKHNYVSVEVVYTLPLQPTHVENTAGSEAT